MFHEEYYQDTNTYFLMTLCHSAGKKYINCPKDLVELLSKSFKQNKRKIKIQAAVNNGFQVVGSGSVLPIKFMNYFELFEPKFVGEWNHE